MRTDRRPSMLRRYLTGEDVPMWLAACVMLGACALHGAVVGLWLLRS